MDGRGGCCIARYAGGGAYDMSKVDRIMLRFRPIAPKPVLNGTDSGNSTAESRDAYVKTGRGKRRYARNNSNTDSNGSRTKRCNTGRKRKSSSSSSSEENDKTAVASAGSLPRGDAVVTLSLLPEAPETKDSSERRSPSSGTAGGDQKGDKANPPLWLSFGQEQQQQEQDGHAKGQVTTIAGSEKTVAMVPQPVSVVGTWVKVECITDTWVGLCGLGRTDEEKLINLEKDTCPGFVSDGLNRVQWTNKAYRDMMTDGGSSEVVVWLVVKEGTKLPPMRSSAFTCSVRLITSGKEKSSLTLPCDVWRMECGGFAWRLDIKAALSLGR